MAAKRERKVKKPSTQTQNVKRDETNEVVLTREGLKHVQEELEHLRNVVRKESLDRMREARTYGEPMENTELENAKAEQAAVDARITELSRLVKNARIVDEAEHDGRVHVGTRVKIRDDKNGEELEYHIVGAMEADPATFRISNQSPMGQALIGHKAGDKVTVATPTGSTQYIIVSVE